MRRAGGLLALAAALAGVPEARAQLVYFPVPIDGGTISGGRGVSFTYQRRKVSVSGYVSSGYVVVSSYSPPASRVTINYFAPQPIALAPPNEDTRGVDLDVVKPPRPRAELIPLPEPDLPGVDVSVPRRPVRPGEPVPERKPPPPPPAPPPVPPAPAPAEPADEFGRLLHRGLTAFAQGEYGLAAGRFQQAAATDPAAGRPLFLLAQAQFALGKYRAAVASIEAGMHLEKGWPRAPFRPRLDLYRANEAAFEGHLKRLESVLATSPADPAFLFLLGYELWFDGRPVEALPLFQRARAVTADPAFIDQFLKVGAPGPVAAK
jgi:Tetratricopeptide repeat